MFVSQYITNSHYHIADEYHGTLRLYLSFCALPAREGFICL